MEFDFKHASLREILDYAPDLLRKTASLFHHDITFGICNGNARDNRIIKIQIIILNAVGKDDAVFSHPRFDTEIHTGGDRTKNNLCTGVDARERFPHGKGELFFAPIDDGLRFNCERLF